MAKPAGVKLGQETIDKINANSGINNRATLAKKLPIWFRNIALNLRAHNLHYGSTNSVSVLRDTYGGMATVVLGTGPTLDKNLKDLSAVLDNNVPRAQLVVIASPSSFPNAKAHDITPDYVIAYDPHEITCEHFRDVPTGGTTLLTNPTVHPSVPVMWKAQDATNKIWEDGENVLWYSQGGFPVLDVQQYLFKHIPVFMGTGCVVNGMVQMGYYMGCRQFFLLGCDFAYTKGEIRAKKWVPGNMLTTECDQGANGLCHYPQPTSELQPDAYFQNRPVAEVQDIKDKTTITDMLMLSYRRALSEVITCQLRGVSGVMWEEIAQLEREIDDGENSVQIDKVTRLQELKAKIKPASTVVNCTGEGILTDEYGVIQGSVAQAMGNWFRAKVLASPGALENAITVEANEEQVDGSAETEGA